MELHHVGVATPDAAALAETVTAVTNTPIVHEEAIDELEVVFLDLGGTYLELLEPMSETGTVARYLERSGPGLHHIALETEDVHGALQRSRDNGISLIDESPRPGAWNHEVAFLHPEDTGGVLIEFVSS